MKEQNNSIVRRFTAEDLRVYLKIVDPPSLCPFWVCATVAGVSIISMGFPENWQETSLWKGR
jgi:hypothetical protein